MKKLTVKRIYFLFFWVIIIASFIFFASVIIAYANGYHLNLKTFRLQQTGMIIVDGLTDGSTISLNGKGRIGSFPQKFSRLIPGRYEIRVTKTDYHEWSKVITVNRGQAVLINKVTLFLSTPIINSIPASTTNKDAITQAYTSQNNGIVINNNELYYQGTLISRFSQNVLGAIYDNATNRFYFQEADQIRALDFDGSNNILLFKVASLNQIPFYLNNDTIYYLDNNIFFEAKIR